jgi:transcription termination/antitermination protein NusA
MATPGTIYQSIEILSKEKGIDPKIVLDAVKDAMLVAARKQFHTEEDLVAELDDHSGAIQIYGVRKVVEEVADPLKEISLEEARAVDPRVEVGGEIRQLKPTETLGRISAQTAKQVILQKVREAERENLYSEYSGRVGELVTCVVKRVEGPDLIADLGKSESRLPKKEQSKLENFSVGDRFRCVIKSVEKAGKNAGVIVSRAAPELVMRLFEQEVPEIYDNTVTIKGCAREAGERTKIAVSSRDRDVDSVGACVGMKGMRVQSIIRELRGEKIDIIEYNEDPVGFATHALSPAKISKVSILDPVEKHMEVIVDDTQLSLAIGKKGQNVRLAAKLLGWRIDIKSEEEKRREVESQMELVVPGAPVSVLADHGLTDEIAAKLIEGGVNTVEKLGAMTPEELQALPGIDAGTVERIQQAVVSYYGQFEQAPPEENAAGEETAAGEEDGAAEEREAAAENEAAPEAPADPEAAISVEELGAAAELAEASPRPKDQEQEEQEQSVTMDAEES